MLADLCAETCAACDSVCADSNLFDDLGPPSLSKRHGLERVERIETKTKSRLGVSRDRTLPVAGDPPFPPVSPRKRRRKRRRRRMWRPDGATLATEAQSDGTESARFLSSF
ncbi:hypothetical protein CGRA01v4_14823 [Colletotrichum graminicola]|nr:hypothetical protein CGRA01v4_14823 [Colletotrichum graminicola]